MRHIPSCLPGAPRAVRARLIALLLALAIPGLGATSPATAQFGFTELAVPDTALNSRPETDFWIASAAPADVDRDGDLDLLIAGYYVAYASPDGDGWFEDRLTLYRNDGPVGGTGWTLTPVPVDAGGLTFGAADLAWGDYDNDGDPDVVVGGDGETALYRNDAGTLVRTATVLPAYLESNDFSTLDLHSLTWADYDNDGDLDLLIPSVLSGPFSYGPAALLRNDGPGPGGAWTFTDVGAALPVTPNAASAWADLEGDGDLDLMLANVSAYGDNFLNVYRNDGGTLVEAESGLAFIRYGTADWGDVDHDGDLDIVYGGNMDLPDGTGEEVVRVLFKTGPGAYTPLDVVNTNVPNPDEPWLDLTAVTWADYDSDGDMDLLASGEWLGNGEIFGRSMVYVNGGGTFAPASAPLPAPIAGNAGGAFAWFDLDGDGDLDYFVAGAYYVPNGNGLLEARTQLFRNDAPGANAAPTAPSGMQANAGGSGNVTLSWTPAADDGTPQSALTYDLMVVPAGAAGADGRALPEPGNVSRNTTWTLRGLPPGDYAWSVRALDSAFNGGAAAHGNFTIGVVGTPPGVAPRGLAFSPARPNPTRSAARFTLSVDREQPVTVAAYDVTGRRLAVLHRGPLAAGVHPFALDAASLPGGLCFVRAQGDRETASLRLTVLR